MPIKEDLLDSDYKQLRSGAAGLINNLSDQSLIKDDDSNYKAGKA